MQPKNFLKNEKEKRKVGYDVVTPGNHEFDYGMDQFLNVIVPKMKATYVSANFMKDDKPVFDTYKMTTFGSRNVGKGENGGFLQVSGVEYSINTYLEPSIEVNENGEFVFVMFKNNKILQDEVMIDNQVLINYIQNNLKGVVGSEYAQAQGRITITSTTELSDINQRIALKNFKTKLTTKKQKGAIKLSWKACTEVKGVTYQVYKSTKKSSGFKRAITTSKKTYTAKKLKKGKTYYFKVRAIKKIDGKTVYSKWSNVSYKKAA